jgi:hypothetical protein
MKGLDETEKHENPVYIAAVKDTPQRTTDVENTTDLHDDTKVSFKTKVAIIVGKLILDSFSTALKYTIDAHSHVRIISFHAADASRIARVYQRGFRTR